MVRAFMPGRGSWLNRFLFVFIFLAVAGSAWAQPTLVVSPTQLNFVQDSSLQAPPFQTVSVTSVNPNNALISLSGAASWLTYNQSSATAPSILNVNVQPAGLSIGTYTAAIVVSSPGASSVTINVTLTVNAAPPSPTTPTQLSFNYTSGGAQPSSQSFYVNYSSTNFTVGVNQPWLFTSVNSGSVPALVSVSVNPYGLLPGTYNGVITVAFNTNPVVYQLVNVTFTVDGGTQLWTTSGELKFTHKFGDPAPLVQTLSISYPTIVIYIAQVQSSGWLKIDNNTNTGLTPANIEVSIDPTGLVAGTYGGSITISSPGVIETVTVPVTLTVTGSPALSVGPTTLVFDAPAGGASQSKTVSVSSTPTTGFSGVVALGNSWLSISPTTGNTPATVNVTVSPGSLGPGQYKGSILFGAPGGGAQQLVGVTLNVTGTVTLTASPLSLQFSSTPANPTPAAQAISVTSNFPATVAAAASQGWLMVTPASANSPTSFSVSVVTAGLASGVYSGIVTISAPAAGQTIQIPVSLTVGGAKPTITEISNGAGTLKDFAPGSTMILKGLDMGPQQLLVAPINGVQQLPQTLGGTRVIMNNIAAPLVSVSATQVQAMVPFEVAGQGTLTIRVEYQSISSDSMSAPLYDNAPILFTADGSGHGGGAIVNQNGSINSPGSPAARGTVVAMYGAGGGLFARDLLSGSIVTAIGNFRYSVSVFIGGTQADVLYAGPAPGQVAGIFQINAYVPFEVVPGSALPVTVRVGSGFSQPGVTLAAQ